MAGLKSALSPCRRRLLRSLLCSFRSCFFSLGSWESSPVCTVQEKPRSRAGCVSSPGVSLCGSAFCRLFVPTLCCFVNSKSHLPLPLTYRTGFLHDTHPPPVVQDEEALRGRAAQTQTSPRATSCFQVPSSSCLLLFTCKQLQIIKNLFFQSL